MGQKEIWRQAVDENYEPIEGYKVSNLGRVVGRTGKVLTGGKCKGYKIVVFYKKGGTKNRYVHRLVAFAFPEICGRWFEGATVDHLNGIKSDNKACNLRFKTLSDNLKNPVTYNKTLNTWRRNASNARVYANAPDVLFKKNLKYGKRFIADGITQVFQNVPTFAEYIGVSQNTVYTALSQPDKHKTVAGFTVRYAD